ncbi:DUF333 domain-containing protein [Ruegeria sp. MALMAid1280]|uniref:putative hemolysin n=1 Tax=Ruegeria sp. MALMAid1280 TaxID=3411634 RepID=UPI003B9FFFC4
MSRILLAAVGFAVLTACQPITPPELAPQLANPAATFCVESGMRYEIRDGDNGQTGVCILPDGREVDAWKYFRENSPT